MALLDVLNTVSDDLWYVALILIVVIGIVCTVKLRGLQFRSWGEMWRCTFRRDASEGKLSSFHVFCMSMGSRIGVGNITGPVLAILMGGPGAIFWMWVFALLGMATSFVETTVGQIYKQKGEDGQYHGGMAYGITKGLGNRRLGMLVAAIMILMYLVGFISMEVTSMTESLVDIAGESSQAVFAVLLTMFVLFIVAGGVNRVANLSVRIVPVMAVAWFAMCIVAIALQGSGILNAFAEILGYAFSKPESLAGGFLGTVIMYGMKRGVMSNEAGIGTIPNLSSMSDVKHPVSQGYSQALGVFIDLLVSTMTALLILSYADFGVISGMGLDSLPLLQSVLGDTLGSVAPYLVFIFLFFFAFTCLMSDYVIGENNLKLLTSNPKARIAIIVLVAVVVFVSAFYASDELYVVVDILLAVCAFANAYFLLRLGRRAFEAYRDYRAQKEAGVEEPEFHKSCLSDSTGVTEWDD